MEKTIQGKPVSADKLGMDNNQKNALEHVRFGASLLNLVARSHAAQIEELADYASVPVTNEETEVPWSILAS